MLPLLEDGSGLIAGQISTSATARSASTPATRTWTLATTPKIVSGIDEGSLTAVQAFYDSIVDADGRGLLAA